MRRLLLLTFLVAAFAGAGQVATAHATSPCGTISASTTLTADCAAPLTVGASGITVDLGGHSVVCDTPVLLAFEIPPQISGATVKNGSVHGGLSSCFQDVLIEGASNQLTSFRALDATGTGIVISGDSNRLVLVTANFNGQDGLSIVEADHNFVRQGTFAANGRNGVSLSLGDVNTITRNRTFLNDGDGIRVGAGSTATVVDENHAFLNDTGIEFTQDSTASLAALNQTYQNNVGIRIDGSTGNSVVLNGSYANHTWDMEDDNTNCDSNNWLNNLFSTANQGCIG